MGDSIEDLLKLLQNQSKTHDSVNDSQRVLENSRETWRKIQEGTWADGMNFDSDSEKTKWLKEWMEENPYSNI